jgi:hypothetical protein
MTNKKEVTIGKNEASDLEEKYRLLSLALDEGWKGLIIDVNPSRSREFFGTDTYDDREGYKVTVKIQSANGDSFTQFFAFPDIRGITKSNLYAFEKKYKSVPRKGLEVDVIINDNGFFEIVF